MKTSKKLILFIVLFTVQITLLMAQPGGPGGGPGGGNPPVGGGAPIGGNIAYLLAIGAVFGFYKVKSQLKKNND